MISYMKLWFFDCKVFIIITTNDLSKFLQKFNQSFQGFKIYWSLKSKELHTILQIGNLYSTLSIVLVWFLIID